MKILVVDDTPDNVELICQILEDEHEMIRALSGKDAIKLAAEEQPDLILLDAMMPDMDGYDTLQKLKQDEKTAEIVVVFLSARYKDVDRVVKGLSLGGFDYLTKPIEDEVLQAKIRAVERVLQAEGRLKKSLEEKTLLLYEVHHRVKNNLQIMSGLLKLQAREAENGEVRKALVKAQDRIHSMAITHKLLYGSKNFLEMDLKDFLSSLCRSLKAQHQGTVKADINLHGEPVTVGIDYAVPCGLVLNELVSNSLMHAFPDGTEGRISISITSSEENEVVITIDDNGVGIPDKVNFETAESMGLSLVRDIVKKQLNGRAELDRSEGTKIKIRFKAPERQGRI